MTAKTYPYTAWRLLPSFKPVPVEIARVYADYRPEWLVTNKGTIVGVNTVYDTQADAIAAGRARLEAMSDKYRAMGVSIFKKRAALDAAEKGGAA